MSIGFATAMAPLVAVIPVFADADGCEQCLADCDFGFFDSFTQLG